MFLDYYGLSEQPFGVTPDPRFLYLGPKHRQALAALLYGTENNRGFLALIAKPGMGKTSLLFQYLDGLRTKARTAFLFQTGGDSNDLMRYLLEDLGLDGTGKDLPEMHAILNRVLMEEARGGRQFILVIDEAQNLNEKVLESVRLLSNLETPSAKLMQIVLAGQPQLAERLARDSMAQLRQRISFTIRIEPLVREEVDAYVDHRLSIAGYKGSPLFTDGARRLISEQSEGIPRNINNICFSAMSLGWALKQRTIDGDIVRDTVADLGLSVGVHAPAGTSSLPPPVAITLSVPAEQRRVMIVSPPVPSSDPAVQGVPSIESVPAAQADPQTIKTNPVTPVRPITTRATSTGAASRARVEWRSATVPLSLSASSGPRNGALVVAVWILLVTGAATGGYWIYRQGQRPSNEAAPSQAMNVSQSEAASPVVPQVIAPVHDVPSVTRNSIRLHSARTGATTESEGSERPLAEIKSPVLNTVSSNSAPLDARPALTIVAPPK